MRRGARVGVCCAVLGAAAVVCDYSQTTQAPSSQSHPKQSIHDPAANPVPDRNEQMAMEQRQMRKASYEAANTERKRQLTDDSAKLLLLATELKEDVGKSSKDTLSLDVLRKADEIARLAHNVQVKMKLTETAAY
jgi:hypothetical protein